MQPSNSNSRKHSSRTRTFLTRWSSCSSYRKRSLKTRIFTGCWHERTKGSGKKRWRRVRRHGLPHCVGSNDDDLTARRGGVRSRLLHELLNLLQVIQVVPREHAHQVRDGFVAALLMDSVVKPLVLGN